MKYWNEIVIEGYKETDYPGLMKKKDLSAREDTLPCPFCGKHDIWAISYETPVGLRWYVYCITCGARKDQGFHQTWQQALSGWNTRNGELKGADA